VYSRILDGEKLIILLNFKNKMSLFQINDDLNGAVILANNYPVGHSGTLLRPYEAVVYKLKPE
jgi:oligo-1,6-glucosidase